MQIERIWAMPNKHTFTIKPIKELIGAELCGISNIIDPFAGFNSPGSATNDLNPDAPTLSHIDALEFLKQYKDSQFDAVIYDPPYSYRQVSEMYKGMGIEKFDPRQTRQDYWSDIRNELARLCKPNGIAISCGWNSMGLGKTRGFRMERVLLVPHGGNRNDTIVTVEVKNAN